MAGFLVLLIFIVIGLAASNRIFSREPIYTRVWAGGLIGLLGLMWGVVPFAFFFGFSITSHILSIGLMIVFYLLVRQFFHMEGSLEYKSDGVDYVLYLLVVPISAVMIYLLNGHVLAPGMDGGLYAGQSTYGDLCLHLGIITSIGTQGKFPPDYSIFPGQLLSYPFLADSLSSSLYLFGMPLRQALLIPSYIIVVLLVAGFFIFANEILKHKYAAAFAALLFFFNGGFGFVYFMDGLKKDPPNFSRMFSAWYNTPTNYNDHTIRWSNTICDMIIPQRTTLAGWLFVLFALWLLYRAIIQKNRRYFACAGIVAGLMPMIHTHSFLALGIIAAVWFAVYLFQSGEGIGSAIPVLPTGNSSTWRQDGYIMKWISVLALSALVIMPGFIKSYFFNVVVFAGIIIIAFVVFYISESENRAGIIKYIKNWLFFGIPVIALAIPQLFFWTFKQATGSGFVRWQPGWSVNDADTWIWFWIKNVGLVFILLFPALLAAKRRMLSVYSGALAVFAVASLILFQPNDYDNNKLFFIWYMFTVIIVSAYVFSLYKRMDGIFGRWSLVVGILIFCTLSGVLTIGRELKSNGQYMLFDANAVKAAEFIKANTPSDALFISSDEHNNPVAALSGRNIFSGAGIYLYFHGINKEERDAAVTNMYEQPDSFASLAAQYKVDYVYYSSYERDKFKVESEFFENNYPTVFHQGDIYIFAISDEAKTFRSQGDVKK